MYADTDGHCHKRIMFFCMDTHGMQLVVIQYPIIDSFGCSPVIIDLFPFSGSPWNWCVKADVPVSFCMNGSAIAGF